MCLSHWNFVQIYGNIEKKWFTFFLSNTVSIHTVLFPCWNIRLFSISINTWFAFISFSLSLSLSPSLSLSLSLSVSLSLWLLTSASFSVLSDVNLFLYSPRNILPIILFILVVGNLTYYLILPFPPESCWKGGKKEKRKEREKKKRERRIKLIQTNLPKSKHSFCNE